MNSLVRELPLEPADPVVKGRCDWCGDEIYEGEITFSGDEGRVHLECLLPLLEETLGAEYLAELCGYEEGVA